MKKCKCGKFIKNFYAKRCRDCYNKWIKIPEHNHFYNKKHTKNTRKLISLHHADFKGNKSPSKGIKRPDLIVRNKLYPMKGKDNPRFGNHDFAGKNNPMFGKKYDGKKRIVKHHIDLDHKNTKQSNILRLFVPKHIKLHQRAYEYLVRIGFIRKYIRWFDKKYRLEVIK
jgi:hypothetical protein